MIYSNYGNKDNVINFIEQELIRKERRLNVAINGDWGIGKSFVVKKINEDLMDNKALIIDTWKLSELKTLDKMIKYEFLDKCENYEEINNTKEFLINAAASIFNYVADNNNKIGFMREFVRLQQKVIVDKNIEIDYGVFDFLEELKKIGVDYIFIDELDRCLPEISIEIFKQIIFINKTENKKYPLFITSTNLSAFSATLKHLYGESYQSEAFFDKTFDIILNVNASLMDKFMYLEEKLKVDKFFLYYGTKILNEKEEKSIYTILNKMTFRKIEKLAEDIKFYGLSKQCKRTMLDKPLWVKRMNFVLDLLSLKYIDFNAYYTLLDENININEWQKNLSDNYIYYEGIYSYQQYKSLICSMTKSEKIYIEGA